MSSRKLQLNSSLTNESAETFNFGILNGKRGFFTDSSRGADTFVPFNSIKYFYGTESTYAGNTSIVDLGNKILAVFAWNDNTQNDFAIMKEDGTCQHTIYITIDGNKFNRTEVMGQNKFYYLAITE